MHSALLPLVIVSLLAAQQNGSSTPPRVPQNYARFLERSETSRRGAIVDLEFQLRGIRSTGLKTSAAAKRMQDLEESLKSLRENRTPLVTDLYFPPQIGDIGRLPGLACHVEQILGEREMLVSCSFPLVVKQVKQFQLGATRIVQPVTFLVRGLATGDFHEGGDVQLLDVFEIVGRQSYRTDQGQNNRVLVLTTFDLKVLEPYRSRAK